MQNDHSRMRRSTRKTESRYPHSSQKKLTATSSNISNPGIACEPKDELLTSIRADGQERTFKYEKEARFKDTEKRWHKEQIKAE